MKLAVLFSGGKDSCLAMHKAMHSHEISCLVTVESENPYSYMFHTPNIRWTELQAEAMGVPIISVKTEGEKEKELGDLEKAILQAIKQYGVEGIVTGAVQSVYQSSRIQTICDKLEIKCINPLWGMNPFEVIKELLSSGFRLRIVGIAAYPMTEEWLGRDIDEETVRDLETLYSEHQVSPIGEGGEFETFVYDGPLFKKKIKIIDYETEYCNNAGVYKIRRAELV